MTMAEGSNPGGPFSLSDMASLDTSCYELLLTICLSAKRKLWGQEKFHPRPYARVTLMIDLKVRGFWTYVQVL